jgi:LacI family transcriptional regulator
MRLCQEAGLEIPRDLAVLSIGIHNETLAACPVPLTAVQENHEAQMERVVARLEAMMAGRSFRDRIVEIPPAGIVERGSTAFTAVEDRTVAHAMDYIRGHLAEGISIPRLAEKLEISRATLDRRFQKEAGETPHDFLASERIKMAQELLRAGPEASLEAISRASGFSDRRRFNLVFKQAVGQPPAAWRAAQKPRDA